jgi:hypothetical protein
LKDLYHVVAGLKNVSGFKWDEDNGVDVDENTLPVWNTYVEVSITSFFSFFINPIDTEVSEGCKV